MLTLKNFLWVGLGGAIGAMLRFAAYLIWKNGTFPVSTLLINIAGSFLIGLFFAAGLREDGLSDNLKLFLMTGVCGGFTTFSAFSLENIQLLRTGNYSTAALYIFVSVAGCIAAAFAGFKLLNY